MKLFSCQNCRQTLFFENTHCERCHHRIGYVPEQAALLALEPINDDSWQALKSQNRFRFCANVASDVCNWLIPADGDARFCAACSHNRTIPDLAEPDTVTRWRKLEYAKHRLFYTLMRLGLPLANRASDPAHGLAFDFLSDPPGGGEPKVLTGHDEGIITLNLKEADAAEREQMRLDMGEQYRTVLGHFRHEVGHYFWDVLVRDGGRLQDCRAVFGDDSQDYNAALQRHYADGPPANWRENFVSAYATTHPWEDFAESWAHYLHIVDTLETASAFGLRIRPVISDDPDLSADIDFDPHAAHDFDRLMDAWLPLTFAVNSLNRSMGQPDLYPFVLAPAVVTKLAFIHDLVRDNRASNADRQAA